MDEQPTEAVHTTNAAHATDAELVRGAREGDKAAFETLTARHFPMVYALAYARLGAREAAEDLAQEVFLLATLHLGALADPARFAAWLGQHRKYRNRMVHHSDWRISHEHQDPDRSSPGRTRPHRRSHLSPNGTARPCPKGACASLPIPGHAHPGRDH